MAKVRAEVRVTGRVQGVWFRQSTKDIATNQGIRGWCRNNPDGSVEAVFEGEAEAVKSVVTWCKSGPELAQVDELRVSWTDPTGEFERFLVR